VAECSGYLRNQLYYVDAHMFRHVMLQARALTSSEILRLRSDHLQCIIAPRLTLALQNGDPLTHLCFEAGYSVISQPPENIPGLAATNLKELTVHFLPTPTNHSQRANHPEYPLTVHMWRQKSTTFITSLFSDRPNACTRALQEMTVYKLSPFLVSKMKLAKARRR